MFTVMRDYDLVVIGCGPAGEKAATQAAYYRKRVAIVERVRTPGGAMVNTGTLPSKALRETALLCSAFCRRPIPGVNFHIDHSLSVARFMARSYLIEQQEHDRIETAIDRHGIDVYHGDGRLRDPHTIEITDDEGGTCRLTAQHILIATGSSPLRPDHIPFDHPTVVDADGVLELDRLPESLIIVGAGVIGCEYASIFAEIDVQATVIDPRDAMLSFLDSDCRDHLKAAMWEQGVNFVHGSSVMSVEAQSDASVLVRLENGETLEADALLWAAGRQSNTAGLGLAEVGVRLGERGLVPVNEHYQTNVPSIYAAGDVIGFPALASTSMEQGRIAACHMFGIEFKQRLADAMPVGLYTIPAVSMVGLTEIQAIERGHEVVPGIALYRHNARGRMLGDEDGMIKCVFDRYTHELLGASIVGEDASELIHLAQAALTHGDGIEYFIAACFNYPSLTELYKYAAYNALQRVAEAEQADGEMGGRARVA